MLQRLRQFIAMVVLAGFTVNQSVWAVGAGGLTTQLAGAKALGQGNAFVGQADDPSAIYYNPAGLTQLSKTQLTLGTALLVPYVDRTGGTAPDDKMKREMSAIPMFYLTHNMENAHKVSFGVGLHSTYGLATEWAPTSSVRYVTTKSNFQMLNVNPTVSAEVREGLSIGLGADYVNLINTTAENMLNQSAVGGTDGTAKLSGHGEGWGYNAGILFKPVKEHSIGASYRSQVKIPIKGSLQLTGLDPTVQALYNFSGSDYSTDATSSFILPQTAMLGYAFRPNDKWTITADYEWTQWNVFKRQDVAIADEDPSHRSLITGDAASNETHTARHWRNVSSVGAGANYKLNEMWQMRGGYAFFQRVVPNETYIPDIPDASIHLLTAGFSRSWQRVIFDLALNGYFYDKRSINNTVGNNVGASVNGTYKIFIPAIVLGVTYKFGS